MPAEKSVLVEELRSIQELSDYLSARLQMATLRPYDRAEAIEASRKAIPSLKIRLKKLIPWDEPSKKRITEVSSRLFDLEALIRDYPTPFPQSERSGKVGRPAETKEEWLAFLELHRAFAFKLEVEVGKKCNIDTVSQFIANQLPDRPEQDGNKRAGTIRNYLNKCEFFITKTPENETEHYVIIFPKQDAGHDSET